MQLTLEQLADQTIATLPKWRQRITERRRARNETKFYEAFAEYMTRLDSPCCIPLRSALSTVDTYSLKNTTFDIDQETLTQLIEFAKWFFENVFPLILSLFGYSIIWFMFLIAL